MAFLMSILEAVGSDAEIHSLNTSLGIPEHRELSEYLRTSDIGNSESIDTGRCISIPEDSHRRNGAIDLFGL
jgi:hypothetical protein